MMMKRFVVDAMLGKLALWLRLTGHDTIYSPTIDDDYALSVAIQENRILLTSDSELHRRGVEAEVDGMLVRGDVDERIAAVFKEYNIHTEVNPDKARCSKCNGELEKLTGEETSKVKALVHNRTYEYYDTFWFCNNCESVFFQGGYWDNIQSYMEHISNLI